MRRDPKLGKKTNEVGVIQIVENDEAGINGDALAVELQYLGIGMAAWPPARGSASYRVTSNASRSSQAADSPVMPAPMTARRDFSARLVRLDPFRGGERPLPSFA
jgi:hypothetical protein